MKSLIKITSIIMALLVLNLVVSCKKEEVKYLNQSIENSSNNNEVDKPIAPWLVYLAAAVVIKVVVELSEGQFQRVIYKYPDGSQVIKESCTGVGTCAIPGVINNNGGPGDGQPLSSEELGFDIEVSQEIDGEYIKLNDGRIVFTINPSNQGYNDFFYSNVINISKPYIIDNPIFLAQMGLENGSTLTVSGDYDVFADSEGQKYIVIQ